ncbi:LuxR C-terminal-related transcriptional regulator [Nonomuraea sediminis]|uniref:LuxR C-terminal-related transcriptional regulator n=1 Tax=Nonomuraea sediminis TaxID=2835864 RepID=UPI001BDDAF98|nr:LuxR C-terminal-related transcriptional regulator [Nonomuraea sediminis]
MTATTSSASRRQQIVRLPAEVTSFVGRRHEVAEVKRRLSMSRAVTLTGAGGVGKTRLALHVALEVARDFRGGVWFVELAAVENPDVLPQILIEALEIRDHSRSSPVDVLAEYLRDRRALIILDNCEHLVHECAVLAETLLRRAPELRILSTSREALSFAGEQTLAVPTLPLPDLDGANVPAEELAQGDAVCLFAERARAVLPTFAITEDNKNVVVGICRRLDGLPLGIELAAVRLRALSVHQLYERLDDRFRLLTAGSRAVLPRHQTLRALIDWSHALCSEKEQLMWARVSVFAGGLDLEGAEAVCSFGGIEREEVIELVSGLVDKSVLIREEHGSRARYRMLEIIRQYGLERLADSGEAAQVQQRHRDYYKALAAEGREQLFGPSQVAWFARLQLEHANLHVALERFFDTPSDAAAGLDMVADLLYHWISGFYLRDGRLWLDRGLAATPEPSEVRARALWANAWLTIIQADTASATRMLEESRSIGEKLGLSPVLAYVALFCGMIAMYGGDSDAAIAHYQEALERHRANDDPVGTALALIRLSMAHSFRGDSPTAVALGEECLAVCDAHEEGWHKAYMMMALGLEVWRQGDTERATKLETQSLTFNRALDDPLGVGVNLEVLAWIAATDKQYRRAAELLGILETIWHAIGAPLSGYGHLARYHDECVAMTVKALGDAAFAAAFKRGARLSYGDALAYALQEDKRVDERSATPLTPRETEIAQLVAQGLTNKEIAASLVISQRTAEGHIEHILSKLGYRSRAQIAVWVKEQDRPD